MALYWTWFGVVPGLERYLRMRCAASLAAAGLDSAVSTMRGRWTNSFPCCKLEIEGKTVSSLHSYVESGLSKPGLEGGLYLTVWVAAGFAKGFLRGATLVRELGDGRRKRNSPFRAAEWPRASHRDSPVRYHRRGLGGGLALVAGNCVGGKKDEGVLERRLLPSERRKPFMTGIYLGVSVLG